MSIDTPVVLAAGGTGGHIFPAEALGVELRNRGYKTIYLVTDERFAKYGQNFAGIPVKTIKTGNFSGGIAQKISGLLKISVGFFQARSFFKSLGNPIVIGFGGYPSFPTMLAAISLGLKIVVHEQNSLAGTVNKYLARFVDAIATSYSTTQGFEGDVLNKIRFTGNPVRATVRAIRDIEYPEVGNENIIKLLVTGGSQGATIFGRVVPEAVALLPEIVRKRLRIDQQTRNDDLEAVKNRYQELKVSADVAPFFNDMAARLASSHLLICRAGASTIAEIFTAGRPAILVPFAAAKGNHQAVNAEFAEEKGACWVMPESAFTPEALAARLESFINLPKVLVEAAVKAKDAGSEDAAAKLADIVEEYTRG